MLTAEALRVRKGTSSATDPALAANELHDLIWQPGISLALFYCSAEYDRDALAAELNNRFQGVHLIGCTTGGEIGPDGYLSGTLTGVSIASDDFTVVTRRIDQLRNFTFAEGEDLGRGLLSDLAAAGREPAGTNTFGFLLIDGLSAQEEAVVSALYRSMGDVQLFGGSAGDGERFERTHVYHDGAFHTDAAIFSLVHTNAPFTVFKTQHFVKTEQKMVITKADPATRIVSEINGEPAAPEYARLIGLSVGDLNHMVFATHPLVVRVGGRDYVRAVMMANDDQTLLFACAIDQGIVLTIAEPVDMIEDLERTFAKVVEKVGPPQLILGCDCLLRSIEMSHKGIREEVSRIMMENNVVGFATYGEQFNAMHVNQTFTGVALGTKAQR